MRALLAGAPGAGKGTQRGLLARQLGVRHLVSGDITRDHIARSTRSGGCVLDGSPRTLAQARHVENTPARLDVVVHLLVPREGLLRRLLTRGRKDDTPDVVAHRLHVHEQQTAAMLGTYSSAGRLLMVDGTGTVEDVADRTVRDLQVWRLRRPLAI